MFDRASTFADPEIVFLLQSQFIPVALDQAYQRRQQDTEGELYRQIAGQGPRNDFQGTTQGFYIATPSGQLLLYNNNRDPAKLRRLMRQSLDDWSRLKEGATIEKVTVASRDPRYAVEPPKGGLVVRVRAKVLGGYPPTDDEWDQIFQSALSRDNLWITAEEQEALCRGEIPPPLQRRIARFHLVDNTRGEPPMWRPNEIRELEMKLENGQLRGSVHLETVGGKRGYEAKLFGRVAVVDGRVTQLEWVADGKFWGDGEYTRGAPQGRFPFAVAFTLADGSDVADAIPPQGSRGWVEGYLSNGE